MKKMLLALVVIPSFAFGMENQNNDLRGALKNYNEASANLRIASDDVSCPQQCAGFICYVGMFGAFSPSEPASDLCRKVVAVTCCVGLATEAYKLPHTIARRNARRNLATTIRNMNTEIDMTQINDTGVQSLMQQDSEIKAAFNDRAVLFALLPKLNNANNANNNNNN